MNDYIQLKKRNILKYGIKDEEGNIKLDENGNEVCLEFDLEDIETPERFSKCIYLLDKAQKNLQSELTIIKKQQDAPGKGAMTKNEEAIMRTLKKYYKDGEEAIDMFLGKGGFNKIFGEVRYLEMFDDLADMLEPIVKELKNNSLNIEDKIKSKYSTNDEDVLKDE